MQWTRQKRYLPYNAWPKNVLKKLQQQVSQSNYRLGYHIQPTSGLLNDPNGFSFFNHQWHIFYQLLLLAVFVLALPKTFAKNCSHVLPHNGLKFGTSQDAKL